MKALILWTIFLIILALISPGLAVFVWLAAYFFNRTSQFDNDSYKKIHGNCNHS